MDSGALRAYADDIVIQADRAGDLIPVVEALKSLEDQWRLKINLRKSEILGSPEQTPSIAGIRVESSVRYLGMTISIDD